MKAIILTAMLIGMTLIAGCINEPNNNVPIGGERDEYGCLGPAGYQWCPSQQKCMRMWEEYCAEYKDQYRGEPTNGEIPTTVDPSQITNFQECIDAGNPVMESYPRQCRAGDRTFTEEIDNQ